MRMRKIEISRTISLLGQYNDKCTNIVKSIKKTVGKIPFYKEKKSITDAE